MIVAMLQEVGVGAVGQACAFALMLRGSAREGGRGIGVPSAALDAR